MKECGGEGGGVFLVGLAPGVLMLRIPVIDDEEGGMGGG